MEGRSPGGIMFVLANCADPSKEAEMTEWYNSTHIPDVTRAGIFINATRYMNPNAKGGVEDPKYLAIYETDRKDVAAAWAENVATRAQWNDGGRIQSPLTATTAVAYQRTGEVRIPPTGKQNGGILISMSDCDPANEAAYNQWYNDAHLPEVLGTGLYWSAMRYVNAAPENGHPKYLAVYETEGDGPATLAELASRRLDPGLSLGIRRLAGAFNLVYSQAGAALTPGG